MEDNRLAVAPVLVEDLHAVFGFDEHDAPFRDRRSLNVRTRQPDYIDPHDDGHKTALLSLRERALAQPRQIETIDLAQQFDEGFRALRQRRLAFIRFRQPTIADGAG